MLLRTSNQTSTLLCTCQMNKPTEEGRILSGWQGCPRRGLRGMDNGVGLSEADSGGLLSGVPIRESDARDLRGAKGSWLESKLHGFRCSPVCAKEVLVTCGPPCSSLDASATSWACFVDPCTRFPVCLATGESNFQRKRSIGPKSFFKTQLSR